ncbi:MAG: DUF2293 domain-containing protein [Planctomycetota bacterium]
MTTRVDEASLPFESLIGRPGPRPGTFLTEDDRVIAIPEGWSLLPPGDAGLTRRVKASGPTWTVRQRRGRRWFSQGVWADANRIASVKSSLTKQRATPQHAKRQEAAKARRDAKQNAYVTEFRSAVVSFLGFADEYQPIALRLADAVTRHATPVGSGTVARTQRIPLQQRAESAVIAWMRHQTTAYDGMVIRRVRGERRQVRRELATHSRALLQKYRRGDHDAMVGCPLAKALRRE